MMLKPGDYVELQWPVPIENLGGYMPRGAVGQITYTITGGSFLDADYRSPCAAAVFSGSYLGVEKNIELLLHVGAYRRLHDLEVLAATAEEVMSDVNREEVL